MIPKYLLYYGIEEMYYIARKNDFNRVNALLELYQIINGYDQCPKLKEFYYDWYLPNLSKESIPKNEVNPEFSKNLGKMTYRFNNSFVGLMFIDKPQKVIHVNITKLILDHHKQHSVWVSRGTMSREMRKYATEADSCGWTLSESLCKAKALNRKKEVNIMHLFEV